MASEGPRPLVAGNWKMNGSVAMLKEPRLLAAMLSVRPFAQQFGSPTCSDWVFLRHLDAIKVGPGISRVSHTSDEWVSIEQLTAARRFYAAVATQYLSPDFSTESLVFSERR